MVDWVSGFITPRLCEEFGARFYDTGKLLKLGPGGEVVWEASGALELEGSYDNRLMVRSRDGFELYLSGNPVKFFQGHNLWGSDDARGLFLSAGLELRQRVGMFPSPGTWDSCCFDGPRLTRADITRSYRMPSAQQAREWLREVASTARTRRSGALYNDGTVYFGKGSEYWQLKVYHKGDELRARGKMHQLSERLHGRGKLLEWAQGILRFEVMLRAKELHRLGIEHGQFDAEKVWQTYYGKIVWNQNAAAAREADMLESTLRGQLQGALALWWSGADLRRVFPKNTFYRYRRDIMGATGIDISSPPPPRTAAPQVATGLDPAGWDPEPLEVSETFRPNPQLHIDYPSR